MKIPDKILEKAGLHNEAHHPICILKNRIYRCLPSFQTFDTLPRIVSVKDNFDRLLVPQDHPSRQPSDTYYVDDNRVLRTHTSAHQYELLSKGTSRFLVTGDVYRRDTTDRYHYPVFHQTEGVCLAEVPQRALHDTMVSLITDLFPGRKYRCVDSEFPFTHPSWEYEVSYNGDWLEVLGCGVIRERIINSCGLDGETGWAFGVGLERLAMVLFDIPDIRLFWSKDERFLCQFREGQDCRFSPFSKHPSCYKDVSFWTDGFSHNDLCEVVRDVCGDLVEEVRLLETYTSAGEVSKCYRIVYRSLERTLTNVEVDVMQCEVRDRLRGRVELR